MGVVRFFSRIRCWDSVWWVWTMFCHVAGRRHHSLEHQILRGDVLSDRAYQSFTDQCVFICMNTCCCATRFPQLTKMVTLHSTELFVASYAVPLVTLLMHPVCDLFCTWSLGVWDKASLMTGHNPWCSVWGDETSIFGKHLDVSKRADPEGYLDSDSFQFIPNEQSNQLPASRASISQFWAVSPMLDVISIINCSCSLRRRFLERIFNRIDVEKSGHLSLEQLVDAAWHCERSA